MTATINANLLRVAHGFISDQETRPYLQGVFVHRCADGGAFIAATDGYRLFVAHDEDGQAEEHGVIVRLDKNALAQCKAPKGEAFDRIAKVSPSGEVSIWQGGDDGLAIAAFQNCLIDGVFPDYQRMWKPDISKPSPSFFNADYLASFGKAARELSGRKGAGIMVVSCGEAPAVVRLSGIQNAYGVLMPMRAPLIKAEIPRFAAGSGAQGIAAE